MTLLKQIGLITLGSLIAVGMAVLGIWQLRVYEQQGAQASAARAAAPPVELTTVAPAASRVSDGYGRSVRLTGTYDPDLQALVRLAGSSDRLRVVTGMRQTDGSTVAVVRGLVPAATLTAPPPPAGELTQVGVLLPSEAAGTEAPAAGPGGVLASVRVPLLAQTWPPPMVDGYVVLSAADARAGGLAPPPLVLPEGQGRFRNGTYAVQWWIFGGFALWMSIRIARDLGTRSELDAPLTVIR